MDEKQALTKIADELSKLNTKLEGLIQLLKKRSDTYDTPPVQQHINIGSCGAPKEKSEK